MSLQSVMEQHNTFITKPEVQFWVPIIVTVVSMAAGFFSLKTDISLLAKDVKIQNDILQNHLNQSASTWKQYQETKETVAVIKNVIGLK